MILYTYSPILLNPSNWLQNVARYSKRIKGINTKLGILAHHDKMQLQDNGYDSKSYIFGVMPLFYLKRQALVPHVVLLLLRQDRIIKYSTNSL